MQADIAGIFHWPLLELDALGLDELIAWRARAVTWWNRTHGAKE